MNLSLADGRRLLVVSNFTLGTECRKAAGLPLTGRPSAAAEQLYLRFVEQARALGVKSVQTGEFGPIWTSWSITTVLSTWSSTRKKIGK